MSDEHTTIAAAKPAFFNFDALAIRVVGDPVQPWFVAKDVCAVLGLASDRVSETVASLEDDEKGSGIVATLGGPQELLTINESGLYALIFRSRKPQARLFRRWVTNEVLPAIRRTGGYHPGFRARLDGQVRRIGTPPYFASNPVTHETVLQQFSPVPSSAHSVWRRSGLDVSKTTFMRRVHRLVAEEKLQQGADGRFFTHEKQKPNQGSDTGSESRPADPQGGPGVV